VPGLRFGLDGLAVDLALVATGTLPPSHAVARRAEAGEAAAVALSAVTDADAVRAAVGDAHPAFALLARQVKAWARARGLDAAPFGGLPGLAWSVLAARTVAELPARPAPVDQPLALLREFFAHWAAWDWREPVALGEPPAGIAESGPFTVLTPTAPVRSCTRQVGAGGRDLVGEELYRGWEILAAAAERAGDPWADLLAPPRLHLQHRSWLVLDVRAGGPGEFEPLMGRVRGRLLALLTALREAGAPDARAWPRPFAADPQRARYAIGLGRTPPPAHTLAEIATAWARGLPTTTLTVTPTVPTLR
jgi:poly(A) polymerase Pap1